MTEPATAARYAPSPGNPGPHPHPSRPHRLLPSGATDAHCHVFGPADVFPYADDRAFTPVDAPIAQVSELQRFLGFERAVIVQSSCYGTDHSALLDALHADPTNRRGVAILDGQTTPEHAQQLHDAGVRGARLHFVSHLSADTDEGQQQVLRMVARMGWHAEVHVEGAGILDTAPLVAGAPCPVVIDHMARVDLREGLDGPSVQALRRLLDLGHVWVKVSGVDRISLAGPPYGDAVALGALLVDRYPERVLWGTDYPHVNITGDAPDDGQLVGLLAQLAPSAAQLTRLLVTNPAEVFDF